MIRSIPKVFISLFSKPKKKIDLPMDYHNSLKNINNNVTYFSGCVIEILPNGQYKAFDKICDDHFQACKAVIEWKAKHENARVVCF